MSETENTTCWIIDLAEGHDRPDMKLVSQSALPAGAVYRGRDKGGVPVYNTASTPDQDFKHVTR